MKTLRFCFALFGLFFLSNGVIKAQIAQRVPIEVSVDNISFALVPVGFDLQTFLITVSSNFPVNLAISLHACGSCQGDVFPVAIFPDENQESGSQTTEHTFYVELPIGEQAYLTCGYINGTDNYKKSDGGCIIGIDP